jgi:ADP-ribose pyrophosphatase YjhB (NUDIX family)
MSFLRLGTECAVFDDNNRVLLSQRSDLNVWNLPGGRLDAGEGLEEAAIREVREETGVLIQIERTVGLYYLAEWGRLNIVFTGWPLGGELRKRTPEARANQYFALNALPKLPWKTALSDALTDRRSLPQIIRSTPSETRRVKNQLRWRWIKNVLRGKPEPRFPHIHVTAVGLVWNQAHLLMLTFQGRDGHVLPSVVCDGRSAPWSQLALEIRDRTAIEPAFQWVGLWENVAESQLEFVFAATVEETEIMGQAEWSVARNLAASGRDVDYIERVKTRYHDDPVWMIHHDIQSDVTDMMVSGDKNNRVR